MEENPRRQKNDAKVLYLGWNYSNISGVYATGDKKGQQCERPVAAGRIKYCNYHA